jgi:hypothetical protein
MARVVDIGDSPARNWTGALVASGAISIAGAVLHWAIRNFITWIWVALPVWINSTSKQALDDPKWMVGLIMAGFAAPICFHYAPKLRSQGKIAVARVAVAMGIGGMIVSIWTAMDVISTHRQNQKAPVQAKIDTKEQLLKKDADLADEITKLGFISGGEMAIVLRRDIDSMKLMAIPNGNGLTYFKRSAGCTDATKPETLNFCDDLRRAQAKLEAAEKIEMKQDERKQVQDDLKKVADAPETADPRGELVAAFFSINTRKLDLGLQGWIAIMFDLMATFMPMILGEALRREEKERTPNPRPVDLPKILLDTPPDSFLTNSPAQAAPATLQESFNSPEPLKIKAPDSLPSKLSKLSGTVRADSPAASLPDSSPDSLPKPPVKLSGALLKPGEEALRRWASEALVHKEGRNLQAQPLYKVYAVWCDRMHIEPVTLTMFGRLMKRAGYAKDDNKRTRLIEYQNVALRRVSLTVVN